jgi:UDP-N-acetylglucosamine transferase subunit ALG13
VSTLLVCSVGGHLAELHALLPGIADLDEERLWVTFDTPQSRSLLAGEQTVFVEHSGPRDLPTVLRNTGRANSLLRAHSFTHAISTGSGIALSFLPLAAARGARCHYIESFTRSSGPSLTGRLLSGLPGMRLYTQHPSWARGRWQHRGSVLDAFEPAASAPALVEPRRVVVTLGTMKDYAFPRLVERLHPLLPDGAEVLWQLGCTETPPGLPIEGRHSLPAEELRRAISRADLVVAHAGCGSALAAMEAGRKALLVPRRAARGENVDDHQVELAFELTRRGLAVVREIEELDGGALLEAAAGRVLRRPAPPPFRLAG